VTSGIDRPSVPVRCEHCRANRWHVFDATEPGAPHVDVKLVCASCQYRTARGCRAPDRRTP